MSLHVIDPTGFSFMVEGTSDHEQQLSSDENLSLTLPFSAVNEPVLENLSVNWRVGGVMGINDKTQYVIKYINRKSTGRRPYVELNAISLVAETLNTNRLYNFYEKEYPLVEALDLIFNRVPFTYSINQKYDTSRRITEIGDGQTLMEIFKLILDTWELEFLIVDNRVQLYKSAARNTGYILHDRLNLSNVTLEEDAFNQYTYVQAYGDINDGEPLSMAGVSYTYKHPLADLPGIGRKDAPPIKLINTEETSPDANVIKAQLKQMSEDFINNSLKISVNADFQALKDYPEADPRLGDVVTFEASNLKYTTTLRIVGISTRRNNRGEITDQKVTFGDQPLSERYQGNINFAAQFITDLHSGGTKLPKDMLDAAVQVATQLLSDVRTELDFTKASGIWARSKENPNNVVVYNAAGLGVSKDGGQTFTNAITGAGIVADAITSGTLNTKMITIQGTTGAFMISGDTLLATDPKNPNRSVEIKPGSISIKGGGLTLFRDDGATSISNGKLDNEYAIYAYEPPFMAVVGNMNAFYQNGQFWSISKSVSETRGDYATINAFRFKHTGRYLKINGVVNNKDIGGFVRIEEFGAPSGVTPFSVNKGFTRTADPNFSFVVDLGVPTKKDRKFYLQAKTNSEGTTSSEFGIRLTNRVLDE